jgi:protein phosphatase
MTSYRWTGATDVGRRRTENQDSVLPEGVGGGTGFVVAVADGLGGHPGGDIASRCAIDALAGADPSIGAAELARLAQRAIFERIVAEMDTRRELIEMATTLTLAILRADRPVEIGHVGDSRAYRHDGDSLVQITEDHTVGMDLVAAGDMSPEQAQASPEWHILSNVLGFGSFKVATHKVPMEPGHRLLLCTDGLTNMLDDGHIAELLMAGAPEDAAASLILTANVAGGVDNISVVVVEAVES